METESQNTIETNIIPDQISKRTHRFRVFKTCVLVLMCAGVGMRSALQTVTLPDQRIRLGASTSQITYAMAISAFGPIIGAPIGTIADRYGGIADILKCVSLLFIAVLMALRALTVQLNVYTVCIFFECLAIGGLPPMANSVMLSMWGDKNTAAIQALHLGLPIGQVIGPFIAIPFVSGPKNATGNPNSTQYEEEDVEEVFDVRLMDSNYDDSIATQDLDDRFRDDSQIEIAFWIVSGFLVIIAILFIIMECKKDDNLKQTINISSNQWKDIVRPSYWAEGNGKFGIIFFTLFAFFFVMHVGCQAGPSALITVYAVDSELGFSNQEGALLNSVFNLSGVLARVFVIFTIHRISNTIMLWVLMHGTLLGALLYPLWGVKSKVGLWVSTIIFGAVHRPIWGGSYAWADNYIIMLAAVIAGLNMSHHLGLILQLALYGYLYDETVIESMFYMCCIYAALGCVAWYALYFVGVRNGTRMSKRKGYEHRVETTVTSSVGDGCGEMNGNEVHKISSISKQDIYTKL